MPRISRFAVRFRIPGAAGHPAKTFTAEFSHQHNDTTGIQHVDALSGKRFKVRHVTTCKLYSDDTPGHFVQGIAPCSMKDEYQWELGIRRALLDAMAALGICERVTEKEGRQHPFLTKIVPYKDYVTTASGRGDFEAMLEAFYREVKIKDYPPHNITPVNPEIPAENRNGTAHLGMD